MATNISKKGEGDITGRDRMSTNVLSSWGSHLVFIITGLIMPRMIDTHIGQFSLGVWDFCWSLVNYLSLAGLGVGSSVNRYVARFRTGNDVDNLCKAVSSTMYIQLIIAIFILLGTVILTYLLPLFFSNRLGDEITSAQWVVALLGAGLAIQMSFDSFRGVMTGCHRWDMHNGVNAISHAVTVMVMVIVMSRGGGLRSLGIIYLCTTAITEIIRTMLAYRVCPELHIHLKYVSWRQMKEMFIFGSKNIVAGLPQFIIVQISNIIVVSHLGPAALAVFSRPVALVRHVETFINKFSFILTPMASSIQASGRSDEIRQFLIETTRYGVALTLPIFLFLSIYGDIILHIWMGPKYASGLLMAILSAGFFLPISQNSAMRILTGMNLHGRIGILSLIVTIIGFGLCSIVFNTVGWSIVFAGLFVAIPLTLGNGILVPFLACRRLDISFRDYIYQIFIIPSTSGFLFGLWLILSRILFHDNVIAILGFGCTGGAMILGVFYWRYMLPYHLRMKILSISKR